MFGLDKCHFCASFNSIQSLAKLNDHSICEHCYIYSDLKKPTVGEVWESSTDGTIIIIQNGANKTIRLIQGITEELNRKNIPPKFIFTFRIFQKYKLNKELTKKYKELLDIKYIIE